MLDEIKRGVDEMAEKEKTTQQRAGAVAFSLALGKKMTTADIAEMCGFTQRAARDLVRQIEKVLPIERNEAGEWGITWAEEGTNDDTRPNPT